MADEFDGCECVWSHELAMRRLLTIIRQGQSYCTDTECVDLTTSNPSNNEPENFTVLVLFLIFAALLYFLRPNSALRSMNDNKKHEQPPPGGHDPNNQAPPSVN